MTVPSKKTMREVTSEQWADFLADIRTYQTEETWRTDYSIMFSKLSEPQKGAPFRFVVAEVHYKPNGEKVYFIETGFKP